jgi:hypothetical protein
MEDDVSAKHIDLYASRLERTRDLPILAIDTKSSSALGDREGNFTISKHSSRSWRPR